jgi:hypothetical protein
VKKKPHYLIFDDTVIEKSGKKMEFIGKVWDHVIQRLSLCYKVLVMLYRDGSTGFFHSSGERNKRREAIWDEEERITQAIQQESIKGICILSVERRTGNEQD